MTDLERPSALLLDFGGVVVETIRRPTWAADLSAEVHRQLRAVGFTGLTREEVQVDIEAGCAADSAWKNAMSRVKDAPEMTHRRFWGDFVAGDWPEQARALVLAHATPLCRTMGLLRSDRVLRPAITDLLGAARSVGIPVAIVSNALSGQVHREFLEAEGLTDLVAAQLYSDEIGVRKPNPELIWAACRALGCDPASVWYVGDNLDRDVVCGRRAGVATTVLMEAAKTYSVPFRVRDDADLVVAGPAGLLEAMEATL